jgi:hypothetical protein
LALRDFLRRPFRIGPPHQLRGVHEFDTVQPRAKLHIVAVHPFEHRRPGIENLDGFFGMGFVAGDAPHQRILVRRVAIQRHFGIVFAMLRIAHHQLKRPAHFPIGQRLPVDFEFFESTFPRFFTGHDFLLDQFQIGSRVQNTRMHEWFIRGQQWCNLINRRLGDCSLAKCRMDERGEQEKHHVQPKGC